MIMIIIVIHVIIKVMRIRIMTIIMITPSIISGRCYDRILRSYDFFDRILSLHLCPT